VRTPPLFQIHLFLRKTFFLYSSKIKKVAMALDSI